ncbi:hypothetical protein EXU57_11180 [Segetibacter sp. 3557_3]|uniref:alpha-2-macroglobulin family protein n=1 Tax=Segetibacter sp. 3557_3 TaxID=2547429 RepID=UPI001058AC9E|nr:MG2 domain-containing protein [Segetibacter sp. 3557_3]TDH26056.1 hypothetical protein EXU57_11180 [Segetibacter sp. 3557_3]
MFIPTRKPLSNGCWLIFTFLFISLCSCSKDRKPIIVDPGFSKYIESYTSGVISKKSTFRIQFAAEASTTHSLNETIQEDLFDFSPNVDGSAYWVDSRTIEFKPAKDLESAKVYVVSFDLGKVMDVPSKFKTFSFDVQVVKPSISVQEFGLRVAGDKDDHMSLTGEITTADVEDGKEIEETLKASLNGGVQKINWQHNESNKLHGFVIEGIRRDQKPGSLAISWDGKPIGGDQKSSKKIEVPALGDFKVLNIRAVQESEEYVLVQFSDKLAYNQDLNGLITVSNQGEISYTIRGSEVKAYTSGKLEGDFAVTIHPGIVNAAGKKLDKRFSANVFFENRLPSVKIQGRGSILPGSGGKLVLPFEATNLRAVDVSIVKIYENNVVQFLQNNDLNGENELRRVAKPVVKATIALDEDKTLNLHKRNRFSLDVDKYLRTEPGAIYRVYIGFRPTYSLYTCTATTDDEESSDVTEEPFDFASNTEVDEDEAFWNSYDQYHPYGYNWEQRDNPCSKSYYNKERFAARNIIASNIGLTAKRGNDNVLNLVVTDILSTAAISGVTVDVLDYQHQLIATAKSDGDGLANIPLAKKPYLLIAKKGEERGYLKVDDGSALPLSRFEVSGESVKNGIKGFIFGERGVWRPGDSLYLSCIIEDKQNKLPEDHPIEMELYSPTGQLYKKMVQTNSNEGFNVFKTATDPAAPTGNWLCKVRAGGAVFERKIKIETVMPNRLKIDLNFGEQPVLGKGSSASGTLTARWLFGAPAQNLKARVDASLYRTKTTFAGYENFVFDNPTANFETQLKTIFDGPLSSEGSASINPDFTAGSDAPGVLSANLLIKVFEPGGNFSIDNTVIPYHPFNSYVGIRVPEGAKPWGFLAAGKQHQVQLVNVDTRGKLLAGKQSCTIELYKIQWKWWWDNTGDDLSNFTQDNYNKLVRKETIALNNGKGAYVVNVPASEWGRYLLLVRNEQSGHTTGETFYVDDPYWQARGNNDDPSAAAMLSFASDKPKYNAGEDVILTIPSSKGGRALISIENGSHVVKTFITETGQGQTTFKFKAEPEMSPNVYATVSLLQPHAQTVNDLPIRMYGVIPIMIEDKATLLKPVIQIPDVIKPEQQNKITVSEASGKDMTYVVALVDEGLLDLTRFKTPDPHKAFYAKEALGVKSWDVFDYVIGAWSGDIERILTIGGDNEAEGGAKEKKANRFKPIVKFMGPFKSGGGTKSHSFTLPAYMGSVRAMVIAANNGAYGFAEKAVAVKKPVMLLATMPRVLGPSEQIRIPVSVFATEKSIRDVSLSIAANPFIGATGSATQVVHFNGTGEQLVYFDATVKPATGIGTVQITAASGKERSTYAVEIDIRNPNPPVTSVTEFTLSAGQRWSSTVAPIGTAGTNKAVLEISSIPSINLAKHLNYLIRYPHGCVEQTTSAAFPQLVLQQLMELDDAEKRQADANVRIAIDRITNFQTTEGGFSYWPNDNASDEWGTNYAGHFLLEASESGFNVAGGMLQPWRAYERAKANAWNQTGPVYYGGDLVQAYRLYLLALAKAPELGAMNRLREYRFLTPEAKWRLAAAYHIAGQTGMALQLISGLPTTFSPRPSPGITFGSDLRDQAMVLETLTIMGRWAEAERLVRTIAAKLSQQTWYSTQTTAYALIAIAEFCGKNENGSKLMVTGKVGDNNLDINSKNYLSQANIVFHNGKVPVQVTNKGSNVLYVRVINQGQPVAGDSMSVQNDPGILGLSVNFFSNTGETLDPGAIRQGTDFVAKVTVRNPGQRGTFSQMALSSIFPSGWEILNTRLYNAEGPYKSSPSAYMDIRDDRVYHYFDIKAGETLTYYVHLNAAYPGKFYWPGVYCQAMYEPGVSAAVNGRWVQVQ